MKFKPVCLIILDGWGHRKNKKHNAIAQAKTPFFDMLIKKYPHAFLNASEEAVGLPKNTIGNSEIGHMTIGTGRIIHTDLTKINHSIAKGKFSNNPVFTKLFHHIKKFNSTLHIMGLLSPAGVHSHQEHLFAFLKTAKSSGVKKLVVHAFTDGRDSPPKSASGYLRELEKVLKKIKLGYIATISGRFYAMDRDKNWHRTEKTEKAIFESKGILHKTFRPSILLKKLYKQGVIDELLEPLVFLGDTSNGWPIKKNDGVFFFNYRPDRARQLSKKILKKKKALNLFFATMTEYHKSFKTMAAFTDKYINDSLASIISQNGLNQSHIAETEKYAHVTYFFNGGHEKPHKNEHHFLIESRRDITTHDQAPQMRAKEIADKAWERIKIKDDFILINFANADMVGHTANKPTIITAVETVDRELKRVVDAVLSAGGFAIITADHGNAETNINAKTGEKHTAHTTNLVPFILVGPKTAKTSQLTTKRGSLADIAPTILKLMDIKKPSTMTGKNLLQ